MNRYESNILKAREYARKALINLHKLNDKQQYDMCNTPNSETLEFLNGYITEINRIYYQEK